MENNLEHLLKSYSNVVRAIQALDLSKITRDVSFETLSAFVRADRKFNSRQDIIKRALSSAKFERKLTDIEIGEAFDINFYEVDEHYRELGISYDKEIELVKEPIKCENIKGTEKVKKKSNEDEKYFQYTFDTIKLAEDVNSFSKNNYAVKHNTKKNYDLNKILNRYETLGNYCKVADELNINKNVVRAVLIRYGKIGTSEDIKTQRDILVERYSNKSKNSDIAIKYDCNIGYVYSVLRLYRENPENMSDTKLKSYLSNKLSNEAICNIHCINSEELEKRLNNIMLEYGTLKFK